jgi:hypothetical protein
MTKSAQLFTFPETRKEDDTDLNAAFEEFWKNFPKKVGKPIAKAKFKEIVTKGLKTRTLDRDSGQYVDIELEATPQEIIDGAKRYARSLIDMNTFKRKVEDKFVLHPSTYLNRGSWMNEE